MSKKYYEMSKLERLRHELVKRGHSDMQVRHVRGDGYSMDSGGRNKPPGTAVYLGDDFYVALDNVERWCNGENI